MEKLTGPSYACPVDEISAWTRTERGSGLLKTARSLTLTGARTCISTPPARPPKAWVAGSVYLPQVIVRKSIQSSLPPGLVIRTANRFFLPGLIALCCIRGKRCLRNDIVAYQLAIDIDLSTQPSGREIKNQPLAGPQGRWREWPIPPRHALIITFSRDDVRWRGRSGRARRRLVEIVFFNGRRQRHAHAGLVVEHRPSPCRRIHRQVREVHLFRKIEGVILPGRFRVQPQPPSLIEIGGVRHLRTRERDKEEWKNDA